MTSRDFCYWLQGFFEITNAGKVDTAAPALENTQVDMIQRHLALVFVHEIDPSMGDAEHQAELNKIHERENATIEELKKDVEALKSRPPQVVHGGSPFGPSIRC